MSQDNKDGDPAAFTEFLGQVTSIVKDSNAPVMEQVGLSGAVAQTLPGKMLRSRLAARQVARRGIGDDETLATLCAAVELIHTASLLHDDVIDNGLIRRAQPALWTKAGPSAAVLIGDIILSNALGLVAGVGDGRYVSAFTRKVREVCLAEAEQELKFRGQEVTTETCIGIARRKTGPLFSFVGLAAGGADSEQSEALEEAGYLIGTAYQLFDDVLDVVGSETKAKKTLGTDVVRSKYTAATGGPDAQAAALADVGRFCKEAVELVSRWPNAAAALREYLDQDIRPVFSKQLNGLGVVPSLSA